MNCLKSSLIFVVFMFVALTLQATSFVGSRTDFRDESIYFVMTTRFYDGDVSNNTYCWDGMNEKDPEWRGDFKGLISKLDYIKALGFTAVWVTPVVENASGYDYHGYHTLNFSKEDPRYQSEDCSFKDLVDAVHKRGMKIILDIVLQHTGNFGEETLCPLFSKDYTQNQSNIDKSLKLHLNSSIPSDYNTLPSGRQYSARLSRMKNTSDENGQAKNWDSKNYWHHYGQFNWDDITCQWAQIAGDCVDLNTENPAVYNYLVECYSKFIAMGVDGFRIDTARHINRLVFNKVFNPRFMEAAKKVGKDNFFMFGEVCTRDRNVVYRNTPPISTPYYTWSDSKNYAWSESVDEWKNLLCMQGTEGFISTTNQKSCIENYNDDNNEGAWRASHNSNNAFLVGNDYHKPDYSQHSGLNVIDFPMHWNFENTNSAWGVRGDDKLYNDASFNVTYVDSHDYAPDGAPEGERFAKGQDTWASNLDLMFTFRGVPCIYYGSEIEFRKGFPIDKGPTLKLKDTGRAYFGGYIKGEISVNDFASYSGATGNIAATLSHPLAQHIQRLNKLRMAIPALRKGQYSTEGCSGGIAFKRRYTDSSTDSYALVTINGNATFSGVLNGKYIDAITGDTKVVTNGTLTANCSGHGNMRIYVLNTPLTSAPGKVGEDGKYLYTSTPSIKTQMAYDGSEEEGDNVTVCDNKGGGGTDVDEPDVPIEPSMSKGEQAIFFERPDGWNSSIKMWVWNDNKNFTGGNWPGEKATYLGNKIYKWIYSGTGKITGNVIINDGNHQTISLDYVNGGYYTLAGYQNTIPGAGDIEDPIIPPTPSETEWRLYFEKPVSWSGNINAYVYHKDNGVATALKSWPGAAMSLGGDGRYFIDFKMSIKKGWVIFNDGKNQTKGDPGFELINNGVYTINGIDSAGVGGTTIAQLKIMVKNGVIYILSEQSKSIMAVSIDGSIRSYNINEGITVIDDLPKGFYIIDGKKVIL
ncbi:MAG: alpha-amylase family glycosyl hydrolase [Muribaculaceae bacterium]